METNTQATVDQKQQTTTIGMFGNGRYSPLMLECYRDSQVVFKLDEAQADKLARAIARDFGAAMTNAPVDAKVGKAVNKDGQVTLSEAAKLKNITITNPLFALRALQYAADAGKFGFSWKLTEWSAGGTFKEYLESL